jgi:hypothetical protein
MTGVVSFVAMIIYPEEQIKLRERTSSSQHQAVIIHGLWDAW